MDTSEAILLGAAIVCVILAFVLVATETAIGRVSRNRAEELARERPSRATHRLRDMLRGAGALRERGALPAHAVRGRSHRTGHLRVRGGGHVEPAGRAAHGPRGHDAGHVRGLGRGPAHPRPAARRSHRAARLGLRARGGDRAGAAGLAAHPDRQRADPGKGYREGPFATQAELRELVDMAEANQVIEDDEAAMLHSVFELGDTRVREVMVPRTEMVWIERNKTLRQAMSLALRSGYSRIPVIGESPDDVVGVFYLKDVARRVFEHRESETAERVESRMRPATFVPDSKQVDDLLRDLQLQRVHMAIAIDEYGGTAGLVTIEDILEEIVGEITDEYDTQVRDIEKLPSGGVSGSARDWPSRTPVSCWGSTSTERPRASRHWPGSSPSGWARSPCRGRRSPSRAGGSPPSGRRAGATAWPRFWLSRWWSLPRSETRSPAVVRAPGTDRRSMIAAGPRSTRSPAHLRPDGSRGPGAPGLGVSESPKQPEAIWAEPSQWFRRHRRATEHRQVHADERPGRPEGRHHLQQAADHAARDPGDRAPARGAGGPRRHPRHPSAADRPRPAAERDGRGAVGRGRRDRPVPAGRRVHRTGGSPDRPSSGGCDPGRRAHAAARPGHQVRQGLEAGAGGEARGGRGAGRRDRGVVGGRRADLGTVRGAARRPGRGARRGDPRGAAALSRGRAHRRAGAGAGRRADPRGGAGGGQ